MTGEPIITVVGNLAADPELRFTPSGAAVANFTVASTPRTFNRQTNEWDDGETLWLRCSAWREMAENAAESLVKGNRVVVTGRLKQRSYETNEGEKRTAYEMDVDEVGPSLKYATARVTRTERQGGGGNAAQQAEFGGQVAAGQQAQQSAQGDNPWATAPQQQAQQAPAWGQQAPAQQAPAQAPPAPAQQQQGQQQGGWGQTPTYGEPPY